MVYTPQNGDLDQYLTGCSCSDNIPTTTSVNVRIQEIQSINQFSYN